MLMITARSFQVHAQLPVYVHVIISVEAYAEKPGFYRLETTNPLTMVCANCNKLFCTSCTFEGKYLWSKHHHEIMIQWAHIFQFYRGRVWELYDYAQREGNSLGTFQIEQYNTVSNCIEL